MKRTSILRPLSHRLSLHSSRIASRQQPSPLFLRQRPWSTSSQTTKPRITPITPRRTFFGLPDLSSVLPSNNNGNGNNNHTRTVTATRILPYTPPTLFTVIASVNDYASFYPFLTASIVTDRDSTTHLPTRAYLTVGYGPLSETFTSRVDCDPRAMVVEARSGARFAREHGEGENFPGAEEGVFEYLSTRWVLVPVEGDAGGQGTGPKTMVELRIQFEFRNEFYAAVMGSLEGQMAGVMVEAFEKRVREVHGR